MICHNLWMLRYGITIVIREREVKKGQKRGRPGNSRSTVMYFDHVPQKKMAAPLFRVAFVGQQSVRPRPNSRCRTIK